jgi:hypothetical protein
VFIVTKRVSFKIASYKTGVSRYNLTKIEKMKTKRFRREKTDTVAVVVTLGKVAITFCSSSALSPSFLNDFIFFIA